MDEIKFNELVKEAMVKFNMLRDKAAEYVAISNGLSDGDVIIVPDDFVDDDDEEEEEESDVVLK